MNIHIVLRGQYYVDKSTRHGRSSYKRDFLDIRHNFQSNVLDDLRLSGHSTKLWVMTYSGPSDHEIENLGVHKAVFLDPELLGEPGYRQFEVVSKSLDMLPENDGGLILVLRFDMIYKKPISTWMNLESDFDLVVPWREMNEDWQAWHYVDWKAKWSHSRIGDTFFFLKNLRDNVRRFKKATEYDTRCAHEKLDDFLSRGLRVRYCVDGFYNSDTACGTPLADNPLFFLQRPFLVS